MDCMSENVSQKATCGDYVMNGNETGIDCGGGCAPCPDGEACKLNADCASSACEDNVCQVPDCKIGRAHV